MPMPRPSREDMQAMRPNAASIATANVFRRSRAGPVAVATYDARCGPTQRPGGG